MLRTVANLPKLGRAPGQAGKLKVVTRPGGLKQYMTADSSAFTSFPASKFLPLLPSVYFMQDDTDS